MEYMETNEGIKMKLGITINIAKFESLKLESNEWDNMYDCAMELVHEVKKLESFEAEKYAMDYLTPFIMDKTTYKDPNLREKIKNKIYRWMKSISEHLNYKMFMKWDDK